MPAPRGKCRRAALAAGRWRSAAPTPSSRPRCPTPSTASLEVSIRDVRRIRRQSSVRSFCKLVLQRRGFRFSQSSKQVVTFAMPSAVAFVAVDHKTYRSDRQCVFINYSNITNKHISSSFRVNRTAKRGGERARRNQTHKPIHKSAQSAKNLSIFSSIAQQSEETKMF